jgi:tetratricopeptide (TPR) repeat protein
MKRLILVALGIILFNFSAFSQGVPCTSVRIVPSAQYPTIESATNSAPSGTCVEVNQGAAYYITTWFYVPRGVTLKLKAGVTVNFLLNCPIEGCLETQGTQTLKVYLNFGHNVGMGCYGQLKCTNTIFANYSNGSTWDGIMMMGQGINSTSGSTLDSCIITGVHYSYNGSGAALWILESDNVIVRYCNISGLSNHNTTGIYVDRSTNIQIYKNKLQNNREGFVGNFNSNITFGPVSPLDYNNGNNIIKGNRDAGILAHHGTTILLDPYYYNYNDISGNGVSGNVVGYDAEAWDHSRIYANGNYWGGINPPRVNYDATSYIDYSSPLPNAPVLNISTGVIEENNPTDICGMGMLNKATNEEDKLLQKAFEFLASENYTEALNIFKSIASTSKDNGTVYAQALGGISTISKITGDKGLLEYLKGESKGSPIAKLVYAGALVGFGSYDEAILEYDAIAKNYPGTNHEVQALVKISYTYLLYKKDLVKAGEILDKVTKVAGSKPDPKYGYYIDEDVSVRFLRGIVNKLTYGSNWPEGDKLTYLIHMLGLADNWSEVENLCRVIISKFKTDPNSIAGAENVYNYALSSISYLCSMSRDEDFSKNFGLDSKELFEYLKSHTKDDENSTPWQRVIYAITLSKLGRYEEAILEFEAIIPCYGSDAYGLSMKTELLRQIQIIYKYFLKDHNKEAEIEARIDKLNSVVSVEEPAEVPTEYSLSQNYPNPFNPTTTIQYSIPKDEYVKLAVYDVTGKVVKELVNGHKSAGRYNVEFNASGYASGIYYYRIEAGAYKNTQKMVLMK